MTNVLPTALDEKLATERDHWVRKLAGELPLATFPADFPRSEGPAERAAVPVALAPATAARLLEVCGGRDALVLSALVAVVEILLHKQTGLEDIVVGTTIQRRHQEIAALNRLLALRDRIEPSRTLREVLAAAKGTLAEAFEHQKYPFQRLLEVLEIPRHRDRPALFAVMVLLDGVNDPAHARQAQSDALFVFRREGGVLTGMLEYDARLFRPETMEVVARQLQRALDRLLTAPGSTVADLDLLDEEERRSFLMDWNRTESPYPQDRTIHELFLEQAARTPEAEALVLGSRSMTYRELAARAARLAGFLSRQGVGAGDLVGIYLDHSFEMVEAVLGVLQAGAAYVPLDPEHPIQRVEYMIEDSKARLVLSADPLAGRLPEGLGVVRLDSDRLETGPEVPATPATSPQGSDSLAYVIYTSGSTGKPKGVKVRHRSLVNYIWWAREVYLQGEVLSFALYTSLTFDLTVTSLFTPLVTGGRVLIHPRRAGEYPLLDILAEGQAEVVKLTPSHLELIKERDNRGSRVRRLIVGGEALSAGLARQVEESFGGRIEILNEYGPTEATVGCMLHRFAEADHRRAFVPIGRPAANVRLYVLDASLRPVAENVPGELYIGGDCLAEGYLDREELTAERFLFDPFVPGGRIYKTGDLARRLPGGILDFLGRTDEQVKVRGYRIEPNEIRIALNRHPGVRDSVVLVAREAQGPQLVAFYVSRTELDAEELRSFLAATLLEETIPSVFVHLKRLPLTLNGKVNVQALPTLEEVRRKARPGFLAPRNEAEAVMAEIWSSQLGIPQVGVHDNFFQLGGDSILAIRVAARANQAGFRMAPRQVFQAQSLGELVAALGGIAPREETAAPSIPRRSGAASAPLSFSQERLWFLDQLVPGSALYAVPLALELRGALDRPSLAASLSALVERHESLRTTFAAVDGKPVQEIAPAGPLPLPLVDLAALPEEERETAARLLAREEAERPFDLARGPVLRATLVRLAEERHALLLTLHHIVSDGWSMGVLVRDVKALYEAFAAGRRPELPELPIQAADFAVWQREQLTGAVLDEQLAWWREHLAGAPPAIDLPSDRPRPAVQTFRGARVPVRLSAELSRDLAGLSRARGATPFATLLAAFQALLARLSGQEDLVVGTPVANRDRAEVEGLIGFFANTLALRGDLSGDPSFAELVDRARETVAGAQAHQDLPFEKLVEELAPERDLARTPLFQVMLALQNAPVGALSLAGLAVEPLPVASRIAKFDLTLSLGEWPEGLSGAWEYNTDLFDAATVERIGACFETLLAAALARPAARLSELPLLSEADRRQVLEVWSATAKRPVPPVCLHGVFAEHARRAPDAPAAVFAGEELTYGELDRRSNRLARRLRALGVAPGDLVGLCVERSFDLLEGILGIGKAGAAFLPLDPSYPRERLAFMLDDSRPALVLAQERTAEALPAGRPLLLLDAGRDEIARQCAGDLPGHALPEAPAYVIYTSGSTGRPKGVVVPHRGLTNMAERLAELLGLEPGDRVLQFASPSFDAAVSEVGMALWSGAALVLASRRALVPGPELVELLRGVTSVTLPPSALAALPPTAAAELTGLRTLIVAGEACPPELARRWAAGRRLFNGYGPTEASVCVTAALYDGGDRLPLGRPLPNVEVYVLDRWGNPVPVGAAGELYAGGAGLAHGYLSRPELTAERFVPHPFAEAPGERLYRTGDLVRLLPSGEPQFLGRIDHQVKIRGFRIEPGEIEAALAAQPELREAVVAVRDDLPGGRGLVAYIVPAEGAVLGAGALRDRLRERLPEHMVPAHVVTLASLPLTPNGKVDRRALPAPAEAAGAEAGALAAPRSLTEELLSGIFSRVLNIERVGTDAGFFDLGGHSLLATQVASRVRETFGVELPLQVLFERPTAAGLAEAVEELLAAASRPQAPALRPVPRTADLPLSFAQERLWFLEQLAPGSASYNLPLVLELRGRLDRTALAEALSRVVARHEVLRTAFAAEGGRPVQVIADPAPVALPVVELAGLPDREETVRTLAAEEAARPFDLSTGPLLRACLLRLGEERHVTLLTLHHIAADGWSMGLLVREVGELYRALTEGREPVLPRLALQYADFAVWQREWLSGEELERQLGWWREQLAGAPALLDLPVDRPRPAVQTSRGAHLPVRLPAALADSLAGLGRERGVTPFIGLLAAFQALLSRLTDAERVVVGSPVANRNRIETEGLIGFFVNTLALHGNLAGDPTYADLLVRTRETALGAYAHQDLPFEKLVEELAPQRDLSHAPLFQVMLALQNARIETLDLPGLSLEPRPVAPAVARFDLTLSLTEGPAGLAGSWELNTDLFDTVTVERIAGCFANLLAGALASPGARLSELPLLAEAERRQLLEAWKGAGERPAPAVCLHEGFAARAEQTPEAVAAVFGGEDLTCGELDRRSNRLARHLHRRGVRPGDVVGLCVERSFDLLEGILGIWKAGAAFLPLDPSYPRERLAFMVEDSRPTLVIAQARTTGVLPEGVRILLLDGARDVIVRHSSLPLAGSAVPESPSYVIYTSGSTGRPKGVVVPHRGLANLAEAQVELFGLEAGDRVLQFSSLSFDAAVWDVAMALRSGAALVLAPRQALVPGPELVELLRGVTAVTLPPSALAALPPAAAAELPGLRTLVVAGEACPPELARLWGAGRRLFNGYGPTEASVCVTAALYDGGGRLPLGRPLPNVEVCVLDRWGNPVPAGVAGELCAGGPGLAHGYLSRPELTAGRFVPHPFTGDPGARLYRTGDLVRLLPSGELVFLGRIDHQVKVRGFRIELGEIEAALAAQPEVREAVVVVRDDLAGGRGLVAYVAPAAGRDLAAGALRERLRELLPEHMVPGHIVALDRLPTSPNGKVDRRALPDPRRTALEVDDRVAPATELERTLAGIWARVLGVEPGVDDNFFDLGGHSLLLVKLQAELREEGIDAPLVALFQHPTVRALALHLGGGEVAPRPLPARTAAPARLDEGIAVIGFSVRFPGARNVEQLWRNLRDGVESITFFSEEELAAAGIPRSLLDDPRFVRARGVVEGIDELDAPFFGFTPREAEATDPQHRLFLECSWEALENAGHAPGTFPGPIGLFAGAGANAYWSSLSSDPELMAAVGTYQAVLANDKDFLATRVAYKLDLRGPSVSVQTACSTSLVAVHMACRSLLLGECDMALAGGVSVTSPGPAGYLYEEGGILAPDGHCRPFDAAARGTVPGQGAGVVVLKRLSDALADGDHVHAVIRGSAINNDGSNKVGFTAPGIAGQAEVIARAQAAAGVGPEAIGYVEAHGTGTALGDPIEVEALSQVFRSAARGRVALGSVKSNLGHLDTAAGVAGLIKASLALERETIPPSLHFESPSPKIDFAAGPFYVPARPVEWRRGDEPRRAGVSSFGIGGTNAHVVLEEAPVQEASGPSRPWQLLVLSARTATALEAAARDLSGFLAGAPDAGLADVAWTLQVGRRGFAHRRAVLCSSREEAERLLAGGPDGRVLEGRWERGDRPVVFLFPGQGEQRIGMGRELYDAEPVFRREVDACCELLAPHLGFDLREVLFPADGEEAAAAARLRETAITQPALFVVEYALARLWMEWGVTPEAMLGHSLGEYVAATLAGVFQLADALALVALRGRLMQELPGGAMLSVSLPEAELRPELGPGLDLAAVNGPERSVVSGPLAAVEELAVHLAGRGVACRRLETSHAFHSAMMDPILARFGEVVRALPLGRPRMPYVSSLTGTWIRASEATDPVYWVRHLRETVRFGDALAELLGQPDRLFLEVGPGRTLGSLARRHPAAGDRPVVVHTLAGGEEAGSEQQALLAALGRLWTAGAQVGWRGFSAGERRRRVALPTYPFERRRYWLERRAEAGVAEQAPARTGSPEERFFIPSWTRTLPPPSVEESEIAGQRWSWLVLADPHGLGDLLAARLGELGHDVVRVLPEDRFARIGEGLWSVDPREESHYERLLADLATEGRAPRRLLHLWSLTGDEAEPSPERLHDLGFGALFLLGRALGRRTGHGSLRIGVVADRLQAVTGEESLVPAKATLLGSCRVLPCEVPGVDCCSVDVVLPAAGSARREVLVDQILAELAAETSADEAVAFRGAHRLALSFERVRLEGGVDLPARLRRDGVYLITGGLGGVGLEIASWLARSAGARLALVGRSELPERGRWAEWLAVHGEADPVSRRILRLQEIERSGGTVRVYRADVADPAQMRDVVRRVREEMGPVRGAIHAAGLPASGLLQVSTPARAAAVLAPKVAGTLALEAALAGEPLDVLVLCSSHSAVLGHAGRADYCAANAFLDAFAQSRGARRKPFTVAIGWDTWRGLGMAAGGELPDGGMSPEEGVDALARILRGGPPQVVVSGEDVDALRRRTRRLAAEALRRIEQDRRPAAAHPRPGLPVAYAPPGNPVEEALAGIWQRLLGIEPVGVHDNFFELGGDSILSVHMAARAREAGIELHPGQILEHQTVAALAAVVGSGPALRAEQGLVTGPVPLTPIQHWFFAQELADPHHWNQAVLLATPEPPQRDALEGAVLALLAHHDALRLRFLPDGDGARQVNAGLVSRSPVTWIDLGDLPDGEQERFLRMELGHLQSSLDLASGPLLRVAYLHLGAGRPGRLLLTAHHLCVDVTSWRILLEDLQNVYAALCRGEEVSLPPKTTSFQAWARRLAEHAGSDAVARELAYWAEERRRDVQPLPVDVSGAVGTEVSETRVSAELPEEDTERFLAAVRDSRRQPDEILLTALARTLADWTGDPRVLLDVESHGRVSLFADLDVSRTVGWFTNLYPVLLDLGPDRPEPSQALERVEEQLRAVPGDGFGHGLLRYLAPSAEVRAFLAAFPRPEVGFLYLGQVDHLLTAASGSSGFSPAPEDPGALRSPRARRPHLLDVEASLSGRRLRIGWSYSRDVYEPSTVAALGDAFLRELRALIACCTGSSGIDSMVDLSQEELDDILGLLEEQS